MKDKKLRKRDDITKLGGCREQRRLRWEFRLKVDLRKAEGAIGGKNKSRVTGEQPRPYYNRKTIRRTNDDSPCTRWLLRFGFDSSCLTFSYMAK